jgi:hypothetical protein
MEQKLTLPKLLKKFPAFYGTRRFFAIFTKARHLSVSWARSIQSMLPPSNLSKSLGRTEGSVWFRGFLQYFVTWLIFYSELLTPRPTPCRLSATAYSIYSQLPSISGGRSSIRNLRTRHAVVTVTHLSWWQGPTYHGPWRCHNICIRIFLTEREAQSLRNYN